jgi:hypothetical protein
MVMAIKDNHRVPSASPGPQLLAAGGILAAFATASCCVVPFALFLLVAPVIENDVNF